MALRTKTVEYAFDGYTGASITANTLYEFPVMTIYLPETASRTFKSVSSVVTARTSNTAAQDSGIVVIGARLAGGSIVNHTLVSLTNTAEHQSFYLTGEHTSTFTSSFGSGSSQTLQLSVTFPAADVNLITAKIIITYEYEDSSATTRVKTVKIPIESGTSFLATSLTEIGTNQVPALDTFLPETSKVYRNIWFELFANEASAAATNYNLTYALDAEVGVARPTLEQTQNSSTWFFDIWQRNDLDTAITHSIKAMSSLASRMSTFGGVLHVTYEYNHSTSTQILNSLDVGYMDGNALYVNSTTAANRGQYVRDFLINEPGTITLQQSGFITYIQTGTTGLVFRQFVGAQAERSYTIVTGTVACGQSSLVHRIDSGASQGASQTLTRGFNNIVLNYYSTTANQVFGPVPRLILNYKSDKHSLGDGVHNNTTLYRIAQSPGITSSTDTIATFSQQIAETNYYINNFVSYQIAHAATTTFFNIVKLEKLSGEYNSEGWIESEILFSGGDGERGIGHNYIDLTQYFNAYPSSADTKLNIETPRQFISVKNAAQYTHYYNQITYSAITFSIAGTVSGYTGDGSGITVDIFRTTDDKKIMTLTTTSGGVYSGVWYDNTEPLYAVARQSSTRLGRSDDTLAS